MGISVAQQSIDAQYY